MIIKTFLPKKELLNIVKEYYFIQINADDTTKQIPVIDDCCYDFVFFKEAKAVLLHGNIPKESPIHKKIFTIHNLKPPYKISFNESLTFFTIKLQPWVNGHFFSDLEEKGIIDLELFDPELLDFHQKIFEENTMEQIFSLADTLMSYKNVQLSKSMDFVKRLCKYIEEEKGMVTVNELSMRFNKSRQYLNRLFKKEVLYSVKYYSTTVRILDLVKFRSKHPNLALTKVSYDYGYFDQSHFILDFKKVSGIIPSHFFNNLPEFILRH